MKKIIPALTIFLTSSFLFGCANKEMQYYSNSIDTANTTNSLTATAYVEMREEESKSVMEALKAEGNTVGIALYAILAGERDVKVLRELKAMRPEKPTTGMDVAKVGVEKILPSAIQWGGIYGLATEVSSTVTTLGNKNSVEINGDNSTYGSNNVGSDNIGDMTDSGNMTPAMQETEIFE